MDSAIEKTKHNDKNIDKAHHRHRYVEKSRLNEYDDIGSTSASDSDSVHAQEDAEAMEEECRRRLWRNRFIQDLLTDTDDSDDETDISDDDDSTDGLQPPKKRTRVYFPWRDGFGDSV